MHPEDKNLPHRLPKQPIMMTKKADEPMPDGVKILSFTVTPLPSAAGGIIIQINGLGDDNNIYTYDGANKKWFYQK